MRPRSDDRREIDSAEAKIARDIERTWRHWKALIAEKQDELAAQQIDDSLDADLTGDARPAPRKARLDQATRQQFGAVLEARRQQAQAKAEQEARQHGRPAPDADQVYATLLAHIADELDGKIHPSGMALVWYKDALIKFDAQAVMAGTTDADYLASGHGTGPTKGQAILVLGIIGVLLVALWFMVQWAFFPSTPDVAQAAVTVRVGQQPATLWTADTAAIGGVQIPAQLVGGYPAMLCVSDEAARAATPGATIILSSTQAIRRYQVQPGTSRNESDLLLAGCGTSSPTPKASARLVETRTRYMLAAETLRAVAVRGPDLDPQAIPPNQMEVTLELAIPDAGAGTLILADGRRWAATRSETVDGGTRLVYLVPLAQAAQPAGWELPRSGDLPNLLAVNLPVPVSRAALLRQLLDVRASTPASAMRDGAPEAAITLTVTLDSQAAPLALLPTDLLVESSGSPLEARWDTPTLAPGKPAAIPVRVPLRAASPVEIALAGWRVRITTE
jgi:hypothetical protein